jgi:hypothetical protein
MHGEYTPSAHEKYRRSLNESLKTNASGEENFKNDIKS